MSPPADRILAASTAHPSGVTYTFGGVTRAVAPPSNLDDVLPSSSSTAGGGEPAKVTVFGDLHLLNVATGTWEVVATTGDSPGPRFGAAMCSSPDGTALFLFGGRDESNAVLTDLYCFDTQGRAWTRLSEFNATFGGAERPLLAARDGSDDLFVLGGYTSPRPYMHRFNLVSRRWFVEHTKRTLPAVCLAVVSATIRALVVLGATKGGDFAVYTLAFGTYEWVPSVVDPLPGTDALSATAFVSQAAPNTVVACAWGPGGADLCLSCFDPDSGSWDVVVDDGVLEAPANAGARPFSSGTNRQQRPMFDVLAAGVEPSSGSLVARVFGLNASMEICYTTDGPEICLVEGLAVADAAVDATESLNAPANDWVVVAGGSGGEGIEDGDGTGSAGLGSSGGDHDPDPDADYVFLEQDGPRAVNTVRGRAAVAPASPVAGAVAPTADFDPAMTDTGDVSDQVTSLTDLARDLFGGPAGESSAGGTLIGASDTAATAVLSVEASEEVDIGVKTRFLGEVRRFRLPAGADLDALTEMVGQLYGLEAGSFCLRTKATPDKVGIDLDSSAVLRAVSVPVATGAASVLHLAVIGL